MTNDGDRQTSVIEIDTAVCRLSAVKKAAYRFGDRCFIEIKSIANDRVRVVLTSKSVHSQASALAAEFQNELLDQELREVVADETAGVRNLLLAQAFSATSLTDPVGETAPFEEDPLKVRLSDRDLG